jgi:Rab GDP dissociation inhibitor
MSDAPTDTPPAAAAAATAADPAAEKAAADSSAAAAAAAKDPVHTIGGTEYKYLADGKYDVIICGTGTTECILSGLCAVNKKKVLHIDRNNFYGAKAASLNLTNLFQKFKKREPTKEEFAKHGSNRDWNVDLVPKFLMASGELVKLLIHTKVTRYLDFKVIDGSYVAKGKSGKRFTVSKVPSSAGEALASPLMGFFQKNKLRNFLSWLQNVQPDSKVAGKLNLETSTTADVFKWFGLDGNSQSFIGHAMALQNSDDYLTQNCMPTLMALKLYGNSLARHGGSPYLYPLYGLGGLAEGFARLCAVFGGTFMLHQPIDELLTDSSGKVIGVRAGDQVATAPHIIGDPSYFPPEKLNTGKKVVRSICFLNHGIDQTKGNESCQIIIPALQVKASGYPARTKDIYVSVVSFAHMVAPKGKYIAIVSTEVETDNPLQELAAGIQLLGKIEERFDAVEDGLSGKADRAADNCHISASYDGTSHFQSVAADVVRIYKAVTGEDIDMSIDAKLGE